MALLTVLALTLSLPSSQTASAAVVALDDFDAYIRVFGRGYRQGTDEYESRRGIFKKRLQLIETHNSQQAQRLWTAGVNHLTDWSEEEVDALKGWKRTGATEAGGASTTALLAESAELLSEPQEEVDWAHLAAADAPDQGGCGSCWAFATVGMLEGRHEVQKNATTSLSVQQVVNCVQNPNACGGTGGCGGATVELAMAYIQKKGLTEGSALPYSAQDQACASAQSDSLLQHTAAHTFLGRRLSVQASDSNSLGLHSWYKLPENKAKPLMQAVQHGPVAISVGADGWVLYQNGIYDACSKNAVVNHAVLLLGYGQDGETKYWKIRNSWGPSFGEKGSMRLLRQNSTEAEDAYCGDDNMPEQGTACKPYPEKVTVCGMCGLLYDSVIASFIQDKA